MSGIFSAATPKKTLLGTKFMCSSQWYLQLFAYTHAKFEEWKDFYEVTTRCLKTATKKFFSLFELNAKGIVLAKNNDLKMEQCLKSYHST